MHVRTSRGFYLQLGGATSGQFGHWPTNTHVSLSISRPIARFIFSARIGCLLILANIILSVSLSLYFLLCLTAYERAWAKSNDLISILSAGGYFCLEPRTLQVLFCPCVLTDRDKLSGYFLKRKAPNRTPPKPEFRASCSWVLFGRGTFELAWIWFRTDYEIWSDIWTQRRGLNEIRLTLANWFHSVVTLFVNTFKITN